MSSIGWLIATGITLALLPVIHIAEASSSLGAASAMIQAQSQQSKPNQTKPLTPPPDSKKEKEKEEAEEHDLNSDPEREMLARAAINLRKADYQRAVEASAQILKRASQLKDGLAAGRLPKNSSGLLDEIEKSVKRIRSVAGIGSPELDEPPPKALNEAVAQLKDVAERLNQAMKKLTAYAVSVSVMNDSERILQLSRYIRQKLWGG